ncbi:MAG: efflux RND transporter periplasmic adaptor subunit [Bryobacteraceae bacterium]|nr:efflux RND transporter periplasmic adaptor subunit [Bryobacteraceae bacterium]MDW8380222.1 efflux RND transporter periplasmic adaptor subunit [Bryobacterales bacterium]
MRFFLPVMGLLCVACSGPYSNSTVTAKAPSKPVPVRTLRISTQLVPEIVAATGELIAEDQATLRVKVAGRLADLRVDLGSRVEAGDVIAELEKEDYELKLRQAEAALEQSRARLGLGPNDSDDIAPANTAIVRQAAASLKEATLIGQNIANLFKQGIVSNVDYQKSLVTLQAAEARYQAAVEEVHRTKAEILQRRAEVALAKQQLADTVVRAPFRGAIVQRLATLGEFLTVNAPVAVLVRWHPIRVRLQVPERQAFKIRAGQRIDLLLEGQQSPKPGRVMRLSPAMEAQNRSLVIEGEIPNEEAQLKPGSFVEATITVDPNARGIAVPPRSVLSFAGVERVFIVQNGVLAERIVRLGRKLSDGSIVILEGLQPGDELVLNPSDRFVAGQRVEVER